MDNTSENIAILRERVLADMKRVQQRTSENAAGSRAKTADSNGKVDSVSESLAILRERILEDMGRGQEDK
jgi:hypothetical protein